MYIYKGFNFLPKVKKNSTLVTKHNILTSILSPKTAIVYSIWAGLLVSITIVSYIVLSFYKIRVAKLSAERQNLINELTQDKERYLLYHNIAIRQAIRAQIEKKKYRPSILVHAIDSIIPPSRARQYSIDRLGAITLGLLSRDFVGAAVTWRRLILNKDIFTNLQLYNFSRQDKHTIPFVLKGSLNLHKILESMRDEKNE